MPATTTRKESRERLRQLFEASLEKFIPLDETKPLEGSTFAAFEIQAEDCGLPILTAMIEERSRLDGQALITAAQPGPCPHCRSANVYLRTERHDDKRQSPHGPVRLRQQRCRCRECGKTFSPAGS